MSGAGGSLRGPLVLAIAVACVVAVGADLGFCPVGSAGWAPGRFPNTHAAAAATSPPPMARGACGVLLGAQSMPSLCGGAGGRGEACGLRGRGEGVVMMARGARTREAQAAAPQLPDALSGETVIPRLKRPEELRELLRICRLPLLSMGVVDELPVLEHEIETQQIRNTGKAWLWFLQQRDLIDIGKDPGRHTHETRRDFIAEVESEGILLISREEATASVHDYINSRQPHHIARSCAYTEKLATAYVTLFGSDRIEKEVQRRSMQFKGEVQWESRRDEEMGRKCMGAAMILESYIDTSQRAVEALGADNVLTTDAVHSGMSIPKHDAARRKALMKLLLAMEKEDVDGAGVEQGALGVDGDAACDVLREGDCVEVEIVMKGPLGFAVKIDSQWDGLVYHDDLFDKHHAPKNGEVTEGWVLKVREDGKVDVTLRPPGAKAKISDGVKVVMKALTKRKKGEIALGDKSHPGEIYSKLGISKKVFKEAIGRLYKLQVVTLADRQVALTPQSHWAPRAAAAFESANIKAPPPPKAPKATKGRGRAAAAQVEPSVHVEGAPRSGSVAVAVGKGAGKGKAAAAGGRAKAGRSAKKVAPSGAGEGKLAGGVEGVGAAAAEDEDDEEDVDARREAVRLRMEQDWEEDKQSVKRRLAAKREKQKAKQVARIEEERATMDPELVEARKKLLDQAVESKGSGLKATMARMREAKMRAAAATPGRGGEAAPIRAHEISAIVHNAAPPAEPAVTERVQ